MKFLRRKLCIPGRRYFSIFDTQKQISDKDGKSEKTDGERKPTKRVIQLVDEIMKLTLIEAADLCDLCHEKLALRGGNIPPPLPFSSPTAMFSGNPGFPQGFHPQGRILQWSA